MKKILFLLIFLVSISSFSQEDAWVYFTDKPNAAAFLADPLTMLTQRALDRRTAQGIPVTTNDVPIHQPYINQITAATGITVKAKSKWLNCLHISGSVTDINALSSLTFVDHIEFANPSLNTSGKIKNPNVSNKEQVINKQMDVEITFAYGTSANQIQMLNGHLLHQANYTGTGKIIAVLDSGFINVNSTQPFERLFTNNLILGGYNYVSQSTNIYSLHNHGTMVLSCMGGYTEGQLVGTAPDAQYYLFVTEDIASENPVEESYWVEAAEEADRLGVDIITSSLGYFGYDNPSYSYTYSDLTGNSAFASRGANIAFSKGIIVVASAGNSGATANPYIGVPAEATNVLAIGAVQANENYAAFSSIGPSFDGRVKPDVMAQGQNAYVATTAGSITAASGTSFSGPIMAGMIASFWQAVPSLTNQQVVNLVKQSSDRFNLPTFQYGYGIPDFQLAIANAALDVNEATSSNFVVYPNPTKGTISFSIPDGFLNSKIMIYNSLGQIVLEQNINQSNPTLSLENLNSGVYFYKIASANTTQTGKIIKN
ncbi:S8 family serine peptidase [Flavobacterium aquatile]|uniref:Peptidase S8 n=1 Tax=Flavobacterium aquatile LMG 4008 = ATCC 11947 TaxID=1453498 RepID=A0A095U0Y5_9FLAO|nr:S8 family serine peptidase [Flavobacterium aquatile]KGD68288.1 peptidase S8 [Flavobacterium aquatile LMG 4008 = ATCC 11947]OXA68778.1 peptidase S8 [Flavobacterium aquatile] [Flavobacterium aquatile LMG 4008 = ATCC 11947]GEC77232.1 peptidase S8 [Flavobacterium aquatile]